MERASRRLLVKVHVYAAETDIHLAALVSNESQNDEKYWHYIKYLNRCVCGISKIFINLFFYAVCIQKTQTAQTVGDLISVASGFA